MCAQGAAEHGVIGRKKAWQTLWNLLFLLWNRLWRRQFGEG